MNRETGIIESEARKELQSYSPEFIITGFMPDGYRGIPVKYNRAAMFLPSERDLIKAISDFSFFRVFAIGGEVESEAYWRDRAKAKSRDKTESEERALYEKLKAKYG